MTLEEKIWEKLRQVQDPEVGVNIVDLGLIYEVSVKEGKVKIKMTLTTPGCPMHIHFQEEVKKKVERLPEVSKVEVELTFDPPWNPERMSEDAKKSLS